LEDVHWYLVEFVKRGKDFGCTINIEKTKILTSITGKSILDYPISAAARDSLIKALAMLKNSKATCGVKIVGAPIGSTLFANKRFNKIISKMSEDTTSVFSKLPDPQMSTQLYTQCILQRMPFRMCFNVLHNTTGTQQDPFEWNSPTALRINTLTKTVLKTATQTDRLPLHAFELATLPRSHNGMGLFSPTQSAITAFIIPFLLTIRYAVKGLHLCHATVSISPFLQRVFQRWEHSTLPIFAKICSHLYSLVKHFPLPTGYTETDCLRYYVLECSPENI
jgi:hypothetical protein